MPIVEKGIEIFTEVESINCNAIKVVINDERLIKELKRAVSIKIIYEIDERREEPGTGAFRMANE